MTHFLDIGANTGQTLTDYIQYQERLLGTCIYCFEPSPRHLPGLMETVARFANAYYLTICPFALGGPSRVLQFYEKNDPKGDSFWPTFVSGLGATVDNRVAPYRVFSAIMSISEFIRKQIPRGDDIIIKIDAECAEYEMLDDLMAHREVLEFVKELHVEFHLVEGMDPEKYTAAFAAIGHPLIPWDF